MEALISQLETLNVPDNDPCRGRLQNALNNPQARIESPMEALLKISSQVCLYSLEAHWVVPC